MKKIIGFLFLLIVIISACEKDDFCIQNPVTPKLILRFYDSANRDNLKSIEDADVWAVDKDSLFLGATTDSLVIPLNVNTNQTIYNLRTNNAIEQITIDYDIENEYVSRSCGYKVIFNNVNFSFSNTWITDFTQLETSVENQITAHVQIFH